MQPHRPSQVVPPSLGCFVIGQPWSTNNSLPVVNLWRVRFVEKYGGGDQDVGRLAA